VKQPDPTAIIDIGSNSIRLVVHAKESAAFGDDRRLRVESFEHCVDQAVGHSRLELETHDAAAAAAFDRRAEIADQVLGFFLDLDVAVADDAKAAAAQHLIFREEIIGLAADQRFERDITAGRARNPDKAGKCRRRHYQLAHADLALLQLEDEAEAGVGNEREWVRGIDRLRRQHRENLLTEMLVEPAFGCLVERLFANDMHAR
jgi:hypothetical protein